MYLMMSALCKGGSFAAHVDNQTRPDYIVVVQFGSNLLEVIMRITNISEAKSSLSHLIKVVQETGEPIIIGKAGEPVAILSAYKRDSEPRQLGGSWEGKVKIHKDFDAIDDEINDLFYNSPLFPEKS